MRVTIGNVKCPECGHLFEYDSGDCFFKPYENKEDAQAEIIRLNEECSDMTYVLEPFNDGWAIHGWWLKEKE